MSEGAGRALQFVKTIVGIYGLVFIVLVVGLAFPVPSWVVGMISFIAVVSFLLMRAFGVPTSLGHRAAETTEDSGG